MPTSRMLFTAMRTIDSQSLQPVGDLMYMVGTSLPLRVVRLDELAVRVEDRRVAGLFEKGLGPLGIEAGSVLLGVLLGVVLGLAARTAE